MAIHKEISSTEKLLELIRSKDRTNENHPSGNDAQTGSRSRKRPLSRSRPMKKAVKVGVEFSHGEMKLVMIRQSFGSRWELMGFQSIPYEEQALRDNTTFQNFLESVLNDFCNSHRGLELWMLLSSAQVEIRHIRIPKVPKEQVSNAVYWTCRKEMHYNDKESILDYEVLGEILEEGIPKISVMVYTAPLREIKRIKTIFLKAGFPLTGISVPSFAVQNLLRIGWMDNNEGPVGVVHLGEDWSRVDIFSSGNLILTGNIKTGLKSLTDGILESMREPFAKSSLGLSRAESGAWEVRMGGTPITDGQARNILHSLRPDSSPLGADEPGYDLKTNDILQMILPPLERLITRIERRIEHHALNLEEGSVKRIYLIGETYIHKELDEYITDKIGISCKKIDPMDPEVPFLGGIAPPVSATERASLALALGTAISTNSMTPNLLFTYKDRETYEKVSYLNRSIFIIFLCLFALIIGFSFWQGSNIKVKSERLIKLQNSLQQYTPLVSQDVILDMTSRAREELSRSKEYTNRYMGLAVIGELTRLTPKEIRLYSVQTNFNQDTGKDEDVNYRSVALKGVIYGEEQMLDSSLARYLLDLDSSPLFGKPDIVRSERTDLEGKVVLVFNVNVDLA